jgi:outer membrane protein TolC
MKIKSLIVFVLTVIATQLLAQKEMNLDAVLKYAMKHSKELKLAESDYDLSKAQYLEALSNALPKISVDVDYKRNFLQSFFYVTITDSTGEKFTQKFQVSYNNEYSMNAVLNQPIYTFGKVSHAVKYGALYKKLQQYNLSASQQEIITNLKKAFYKALLTQKVYEVAKDSELSAKENYDNMQLKFESGTISELELLQAEVRWRNAIPATIEAKKNMELAINSLKSLMNMPLEEDITLVGNFEHIPLIDHFSDAKDVFEQRPDYLVAEYNRDLQNEYKGLQFSMYLPTISGSLIYAYSARSDQFKLENDYNNLILGINVHIPIFSGMNTTAKYQQAKINARKANLQVELLRDKIRIELNNIRLRLNQAKESILAARKSLNVAQRAYEIAEARVKNGLATQLDLKDARVSLDQARLNYYTSVYNYLDAYFDYQKATGHVTLNDEMN